MALIEDHSEFRKALNDAIEIKLQDLPPLPTVLVELIKSLNDPRSSVADLNRVISSDQAMSARILRLVNSSFYGSQKITTITRAIIIIGFNTIHILATSSGIGNAFRPTEKSALDRELFWEHSVGAASCAWAIARARRLDSKTVEEAFVGGLLHDLGKLFLDQYFPEEYRAVLELALTGDAHIVDAERKLLGTGHGLIGKRIAERWHLPASLVAMLGMHHQPSYVVDDFQYVAIAHAGDYLARKIDLGNPGDLNHPSLDPRTERWLSFSSKDWKDVEAVASRKYESIKDSMLAALNSSHQTVQ